MLYDFSPKNCKQLTLGELDNKGKNQDILMEAIDKIQTKYLRTW